MRDVVVSHGQIRPGNLTVKVYDLEDRVGELRKFVQSNKLESKHRKLLVSSAEWLIEELEIVLGELGDEREDEV